MGYMKSIGDRLGRQKKAKLVGGGGWARESLELDKRQNDRNISFTQVGPR